jgi:hypothetical protein
MSRSNEATGFFKMMNQLSAMVFACAVTAAGFASMSPSVAGSQSVIEFAKAFKAAYAARDTAALEAMLYLKGTPDFKAQVTRDAVQLEAGKKAISVKVVDAEPSDSKPEILNGNTYVPNVTVLKQLIANGRYFVVGKTPSGKLAIGGIKLSGKAVVWKPAADVPKPKTAEAFAKAWKAAYNAKDNATLAKMIHLSGTPDGIADLQMSLAEAWGSVESVSLVEYKAVAMTQNGNKYVRNVTDLKTLKYEGDGGSGEFAIGKTPEGYYGIAGVKRAE